MALRERGIFLLNPLPVNLCNSSGNARNISASTHWVGTRFQAPETGTITEVHFRTGSVTSPVFTLEAGIINVDASGNPVGSDISFGDAVTNPAANTNYSATVSASVTAGTMYGAVVRVKSSTYTSGSANVIENSSNDYYDGSNTSVDFAYGGGSYNVGSTLKSNQPGCVIVKYSTGWVEIPHMVPPRSGATNSTTSGATGAVVGNKFTTMRRQQICGYALLGDVDACTVGMFSGTDNTVITNSEATITAAYRSDTGQGSMIILLGTPFVLAPGTYRVGIKNTSTTTNNLRYASSFPADSLGVIGMDSYSATSYASGSWTDTANAITCIMPLINAVDDGVPPAAWQLGM